MVRLTLLVWLVESMLSVLLEIKIWSLKQTITEEGAEAIEYIKGLLGGD